MRSDTASALAAALRGAAPGCIPAHLADDDGTDLIAVAIGKAASPMLLSLLQDAHLRGRVRGGILVTKEGHVEAALRDAVAAGSWPAGLALLEAGHPVPNEAGQAAAAAVMRLLSTACTGATVLLLLSGGGSALTPLPAPGIAFASFAATSDLLVSCGASIDEVNAVRKHISAFSGGQAAVAAAAGGAVRLVTLALSDVIGDRPDVIASGPFSPDESTFADALAIVQRYDLALPPDVRARLEAGAHGDVPETPKTPVAIPSSYTIVAGLRGALTSAADALRERGFAPLILTSCAGGEARACASLAAGLVHEWATVAEGAPFSLTGAGDSLALLIGGETTVSLGSAKPGLGGRNQEFALAAAVSLGKLLPPAAMARYLGRLEIVSFASDGSDGPTPYAGALVTGHTLEAARAAGLEPQAYLDAHDSGSFFLALERADEGDAARVPQPSGDAAAAAMLRALPAGRSGGLIRTGATGTNVCDVILLLARRPAS
jgi:glycerate 2-kinase